MIRAADRLTAPVSKSTRMSYAFSMYVYSVFARPRSVVVSATNRNKSDFIGAGRLSKFSEQDLRTGPHKQISDTELKNNFPSQHVENILSKLHGVLNSDIYRVPNRYHLFL